MPSATRALWLVAPLLVAGLVHVAVIRRDVAPELARPIDGGRLLGGRPLLGRNKTWRGFVVMPLASAAAMGATLWGARRWPWWFGYLQLRERAPAPAIAGALCGLAYVAAELPNSFVKRRMGIDAGGQTASGARLLQYVVDQMDSVVGCLIAVSALCRVTRADVARAAVVGGAAHVLVERATHAMRRSDASS